MRISVPTSTATTRRISDLLTVAALLVTWGWFRDRPA